MFSGRKLIHLVAAAQFVTLILMSGSGLAVATVPEAGTQSGNSTVATSPIYRQIKNQNSGKCLDVKGASRSNEALVVQYTCDRFKSNQLWRFERAPGSWYDRLIVLHSGKCLDIRHSSQDPTTDAIQYTCTQPAQLNQLFDFDMATHQITVLHSAQCLSIENDSKSNTAQVHQTRCNLDSPSQKWLLVDS